MGCYTDFRWSLTPPGFGYRLFAYVAKDGKTFVATLAKAGEGWALTVADLDGIKHANLLIPFSSFHPAEDDALRLMGYTGAPVSWR